MSNPYDPFVWYGQLHYQFPFETRPVVRIPIVGPRPFNTLAVIRTIAPGHLASAQDHVFRDTFKVVTPLTLRGYDPLRPEQKQVTHSSAAFLRMMQCKNFEPVTLDDSNDTFSYEVSLIHPQAEISARGEVVLTIDTLLLQKEHQGAHQFQISSWIMCWEPPL